MKFSLSLIILFQILYFAFPADDRLVFLYTHFRHGARAPLDINDEFIDKLGEKWTNPGELTGVGQRMHYLLGLRNRKKYITGNEKFLSEKFDPHEMLIFSSNINRTMVSCSSQLQGLYPQIDEVGYILTERQKEIAMPQVNISDPEIQKEINDLGNSALPHLMQLAPVRMAGDNDRKMNVYDLEECKDERNEQRKYNNENIPELKEYIKSFNEKYAEKWNKYFNKEKAEFDVNEIHDICDAFLSDYADARPMSDFKSKSGVNFTEQNEQNQEISNDVFCQIFQNSNTMDFEDEEEEDNERYYIKGFKENETTMLGKKRKKDTSDKNIIKNEHKNNKRTKESTGENSLKKIEKKEKSDNIKHQFRNDYIVKKIKVNCFSDYMTEELNKATINLTFLDEQKYLKIYMPNNKAFTSIASLKKNLEFLPMTLKDIYTLCKGGEKQDKNKN